MFQTLSEIKYVIISFILEEDYLVKPLRILILTHKQRYLLFCWTGMPPITLGHKKAILKTNGGIKQCNLADTDNRAIYHHLKLANMRHPKHFTNILYCIHACEHIMYHILLENVLRLKQKHATRLAACTSIGVA